MALNDSVYILRTTITDLFNAWHEKNPEVLHPMTVFVGTLGLQYKQMYKNGTYRFEIEDQQRWFLAKIQYGL